MNREHLDTALEALDDYGRWFNPKEEQAVRIKKAIDYFEELKEEESEDEVLEHTCPDCGDDGEVTLEREDSSGREIEYTVKCKNEIHDD